MKRNSREEEKTRTLGLLQVQLQPPPSLLVNVVLLQLLLRRLPAPPPPTGETSGETPTELPLQVANQQPRCVPRREKTGGEWRRGGRLTAGAGLAGTLEDPASRPNPLLVTGTPIPRPSQPWLWRPRLALLRLGTAL